MLDLPLGRRDVIASRLAMGQSVVANALAEEFAVSEDAIRRDLRALAAEGHCRRVYGGALPVSPATRPMSARMQEAAARKHALALVAVRRIEPREFLFIDNGSTNLALTDCLPDDYELTIATNSVDIAAALLRRQLPLIMVGGPINPAVGGCIDGAAMMQVGQMNVDRCFIGACAVSISSGIGAFDAIDAAFKRALLAASRHSTVLVMNDKLEARAPHRVAALEQIDSLVVEHDLPATMLKTLRQRGTSIVRANPPA